MLLVVDTEVDDKIVDSVIVEIEMLVSGELKLAVLKKLVVKEGELY
jgi:hypothetical protein